MISWRVAFNDAFFSVGYNRHRGVVNAKAKVYKNYDGKWVWGYINT